MCPNKKLTLLLLSRPCHPSIYRLLGNQRETLPPSKLLRRVIHDTLDCMEWVLSEAYDLEAYNFHL